MEKSIAARNHLKAKLRRKSASAAWITARGVILLGLAFIILYPIFIKASTSLKSTSDMFNPSVMYIPKKPTLENFRLIWNSVKYPVTFLQTAGLTSLLSFLQMISCTLVAYGLSKFNFFGKRLLMVLVIVTLVIPTQAILTPLYIRFRFFDVTRIIQVGGELGGISLINTIIPFILLSLTATAYKNGLYIFMLIQYFRNLPKVLEEAAYIDGCGRLRCFLRIMLPGAVPMLVTVFLFAFVWQWNDFYYTSVLAPELGVLANKLITVNFSWISGISSDYSFSADNAPRIILLITPLIVLYIFTQKFFVESVERSGIVG